MIDFFVGSITSDDKSVQYLAQLFGYVNGAIPIPTGGTSGPQALPSGVSMTLLGTMFQVFNSVILAVAALIIIYVTVVGTMLTAHEGEFMKKWQGIWMPMRIVLGVGALFPTGSGYCGLQIILMWVIVQGVGAADYLWTTSLGYIQIMGSPYVQGTMPQSGVTNTMGSLFQGMVCDATFRETAQDPDTFTTSSPGSYYCNQSNDASFCPTPQNSSRTTNAFDASNTNNNTYVMGPGGVCGTLTYCNVAETCPANAPPSIACATCQAQVAELEKLINNSMLPVAIFFEQTDYSFRNFYFNNNPSVPDAGLTGFNTGWISAYCSANGIGTSNTQCCKPGTPGCQQTNDIFSSFSPYDDNGKNFGANSNTVTNLYVTHSIIPRYSSLNIISDVTGDYMNAVMGAALKFVTANAASAASNTGNDFLDAAQNSGWLLAGGYYYYLGKYNTNQFLNSIPTLSFSIPSSPEAVSQYSNLRINYGAVGALTQSMTNSAQTQGGSSSSGSSSSSSSSSQGNPQDISSAATGFLGDVQSAFYSTPSATFNPLLQMQIAGSVILLAVQIIYVILIAIVLIVGTISDINGWVAGNGAMLPTSLGMTFLMFFVAPAVLGLLTIMITVGGMFAIYIPLIPYTIFTFGAIGWFLSVAETMVAGPIVALGILTPGGHHEILGKAEHGLMLLFNVFLRPSLMIFGLIVSLLLASVVVGMINAAMWGSWVGGTIAQGGHWAPGPVTVGILGGQGGNTGVIGSPLSFVIYVCAYTMIIVSAMNKCFEAIHIIPEKVVRWIGGQGEQYGESAAVGEMKRGTEAGAAGAVRAQEGGAAGTGKMFDAGMKERKGAEGGSEGKDKQ